VLDLKGFGRGPHPTPRKPDNVAANRAANKNLANPRLQKNTAHQKAQQQKGKELDEIRQN
jgi:hypothetical protein